jgi:hypothetical protein
MNHDPVLDVVLAGLIVRDDPAAVEIDESWLEQPRWVGVVRVLRRHQIRGGALGNLIVAGAVLDAAGIAFPRTTAAEAVLAADEAAPAAWLIPLARSRALQLRVRQLARLLADTSSKDLRAWGQALDHARHEFDEIGTRVDALRTRSAR